MLSLPIITSLATVACAAAIERSAAYPGPQGGNAFQLQVIAVGGNLAYSGQFLNTYHTGAGFNALVVSDEQTSLGPKFNFDPSTGFISSKLGDYPYYMNLNTSNLYAPPAGYNFVGYDVETTHDHFHFNNPSQDLQFGPSYAKDIFAVCPAQIYTKGVKIPTLVYRTPESKANSECADVHVKAITI